MIFDRPIGILIAVLCFAQDPDYMRFVAVPLCQ